MRTVGSYEAKTHLPRLLDEVAAGDWITITKHGVPVAVLVPAGPSGRKSTQEIAAALKEFRRGRSLGDVSLKRLVGEGRRY